MLVDEAPPFWWQPPGVPAIALLPLSYVYGLVSGRRMEAAPSASVAVPVLCVGNFVAGGAGKTPTAIVVARAVARRGLKPGFLSRGYGGSVTGPTLVDPAHHHAAEVGDEPLLLAEEAVTVVSTDRAAGAARLVAEGCDFIILDDGFQNPGLAKDYNMVVVDAGRGIGNGFTIPAGPLRVPLSRQMALADCVVVIGEAPGGDKVIRETARRGKPSFLAYLRPLQKAKWRKMRCLAYAGIGDPTKFFSSLAECGAELVLTRGFPDHHGFSREEAEDLLREAHERDLVLVTTSKDMARLRGAGSVMEKLAESSQVFEVELQFEDPRTMTLILDATLARAEERKLKKYAS